MEFKKIKNKSGITIENVILKPFDIVYSENEKDIEALFKAYIESMGWQQDVSYTRDSDIKNRYKFRNDIKGSTKGKPDYIFYDSASNIISICDTKSSKAGIDDSLVDGKEYIRCLKEDYGIEVPTVIGFDGQHFKFEFHNGSEWENICVESTEIEQMPSQNFLEYIINSHNQLEEVPETENIDRTMLANFFKATDEIIRRSSIGSSPTEKFIELSTIIFLKMYALKKYDSDFFKQNKSLRYKNIWEAVLNGDVSLINTTFSEWLNKTYKNIYLNESYALIRIESDKLISVAKLVDRIFATYELNDFTNVKGDILEYFQSSSKDRKIGEFFTPRHVIRYMTKLIEPTVVNKDGNVYIEKIYDPTCGTGGFLIEAFNRYKDIYSPEIPDMDLLKNGVLHGTELKSNTALLAKMNMILIGDGHTNIINCDAFSYDRIEKVSKLKDVFGHYIPIDESMVDFYMEGGEKRYFVKGDKTRKVSLEAANKTDYFYDELGEKIAVENENVITKDGKKYSKDGFLLKKSNGVFYKAIRVKHYELKNELEENIKYDYRNVKSVNPVLTTKKLPDGTENPCYQENFGNFDIVLANQPFGLSEPPKADYHFIMHMLQSLHEGKHPITNRYGRIACIVDNGFLHDSKYLEERKKLQTDYTIKGIISLPQKVFAPYVKTIKSNIILIEKRKPRENEKTYFVKIEHDGYSLDDRRIKQIENDDFKELLALWRGWNDIVFTNPDTGKTEYEPSHKEKSGFAEYHTLTPESWAVTQYIKYSIPEFKYSTVPLAQYIEESTQKLHPVDIASSHDDNIEILGVSKKYGIITSENKAANEYNQKYKVLKNSAIAYNPSRVNIGSIAINTNDDGLISPSYVVFTIDTTEFLPEYVIHFLKSDFGRNQIENFNNGTVRNSLSFEDLGKIQIPKMSLPEQERLVLLIANTTNAKIKLYDSYNSILKVGIPESSFSKYDTDYEEFELGKLLEETDFPSYGCSKKSDDNCEGYPILKMNNIFPIIDNEALGEEVDKITLTDEEFEKYRIYENDILVNRTNSIELVGKAGLYSWYENTDLVDCIFASYLMKLTIKKEYSAKYIAYYMNLTSVKSKIREFAIQSNGQYNINLENLKKLIIKYPKDATLISKYETEFDEYCTKLQNLMNFADILETEEKALFGRYLN